MTPTQRLNGWIRKVPAWVIYIVLAAPPIWFVWLGFNGGLGPDPAKALEREIGSLGLKLLIAVIAITPIRDHLGINLVKFRRALGVWAFVYILIHFLTWLVLDLQSLSEALKAVVKYPYVIAGLSAFILMIPLAITSNNWSIRKLSPGRWKGLHKLTYPILILAGLHYLLLSKVPFEPIIYLCVIVFLLGLRIKFGRRVAV